MARPRLTEESKRKSISLTINSDIDDLLIKVCEKMGISKSKYIEHILRKQIQK
jgi:antitoxin component of RelBE/YafQ-DinJ toxin-antitoxin module